MGWKVTGCSSASDVHGIDNLYNKQLFRVWQTAEPEKKAILEIEFDKPTKIKRLEIANAGSAFVEVLVGKKGFEQQQFQVLIPITSFMSLHEIRENTNRNRVRNFDEKLKQNKEVASKEWERMMIVCTNPFDTKNAQPIGLAYLAINDTENNENNKDAAVNNNANVKIPNNNLNPLDEEEYEEEPAPKPKQKQQASLDQFIKQGKSFQPIEPKKVENNNNNNNNVDVKPVKKPQDKPTPPVQEPPKPKPASQPKTASQPPVQEPKPKPASQPQMPALLDEDIPNQPATQPTNKNNVVFVLSGFQNPLREQLRNKLVELGATYRADVAEDVTHLIADFENTPKVNAMKKYMNLGGRYIVRSQWIVDSHKAGKKLPEAKYSLLQDNSQKRKIDDDDIDDMYDDDTPVVQVVKKQKPSAPVKHDSDTDEMADVPQPKQPAKPAHKAPPPKLTHDSDTDEMAEEEIASIKQKSMKNEPVKKVPQAQKPAQPKPQQKETLKPQQNYVDDDDTRIKNVLSKFANPKSPQKSPPPAKPANKKDSDTDDMDVPLPLKSQPKQQQQDSDTDDMEIPASKPSSQSQSSKPSSQSQTSKTSSQNKHNVNKNNNNNNESDTDPMEVVQLNPPKPHPPKDDSGSDTDEMSKSQFQEFINKAPPQSQMTQADQFISSAPQEPDNASLPEFLLGVTAYLHDSLTPKERKSMNRYVVAYGGAIARYPYDTVTHVISNTWDDELADQLDDKSCEVVSPDWVMQCHAKQMMVPTKNFVIRRVTK